jgi:pullulanase-type alpha-1,6-glucosidase
MGRAVRLTGARAHWVEPGLLAWPAASVPAGVDPADLRWRLHSAPDAGITVDAQGVHGAASLVLTFSASGLPAPVLERSPHLSGYLALRLDGHRDHDVPRLLTGQLAVACYGDGPAALEVTGVQLAAVLDVLYARAAARTYGVTWPAGGTRFRLWAPTAQSVHLLRWGPEAPGDAPVAQGTRTRLRPAADGSWSRRESRVLSGTRYLYEVRVYQPRTGRVETNLVTDPYSVALTLGSTRSVAVRLSNREHAPAIWRDTPAPELAAAVDSTIYELHVRDFSVHDAAVPREHRGSYLAFLDDGHGARHLRRLAEAGLNTVHLLPTYDLTSVEEDPARRREPDGDLASYAPDGEEQQARVAAVAGEDAYNWGYDPWHWMVPEGSYASSPAAADGGSRTAEFRSMVGALHAAGLRVVLDQVFNHTQGSGQGTTSVLDRIVPGYYHRLDVDGEVETSTCCDNVATEHAMAEKLMVDAVVLWARHYRVDGFRFDLMGHHSRANLLAVRRALDRLKPGRDGVDGRRIYLYGEGWSFGEVADNARFVQASQGQLGGTGIGTFSDRLRDAIRGGGPFEQDPRLQGLATGLVTDPNDVPQPDAAERLSRYTDLAQLSLAGLLRTYEFRGASGQRVRGDQLDFNGQPAGYADQPDEVVAYVDAHDNETLFDELAYKLPRSTSMADRIRMNTVALAFPALSQGPCFWHAGTDLLRSKSLDRNSYNSGDWFNTLDWTGTDNGFGHGLPPRAENEQRWALQRELLADPGLKPAPAQVQAATAQAQELLRLRFSTPLFRLRTAEQIRQKVTFPVSGTADAHDGVVVLRIDDTAGRRVDRRLRGVVVVFNTSPAAVEQVVPPLRRARLALSPVQANGVDPVVKQASWTSGTATLSVPARTVAVFVQR